MFSTGSNVGISFSRQPQMINDIGKFASADFPQRNEEIAACSGPLRSKGCEPHNPKPFTKKFYKQRLPNGSRRSRRRSHSRRSPRTENPRSRAPTDSNRERDLFSPCV